MAKRTWSETDEVVIEKYKGMIYKLAFKSWRQLPASVKMWVEPEDLVADAYVAILANAKFRYKKTQSSVSTFLWIGISNLFLNFALKHQVKKRLGWRVPLEDIEWFGKSDAKIAEREALDALARTYFEASEDCRARIKKWFGQVPVRAKRSEKEKQFYQEFCRLAKKNGLTKNDCRELMRGGVLIP
jgi:DNA-directed RNA polymerase specialized sigma24 family protein